MSRELLIIVGLSFGFALFLTLFIFWVQGMRDAVPRYKRRLPNAVYKPGGVPAGRLPGGREYRGDAPFGVPEMPAEKGAETVPGGGKLSKRQPVPGL